MKLLIVLTTIIYSLYLSYLSFPAQPFWGDASVQINMLTGRDYSWPLEESVKNKSHAFILNYIAISSQIPIYFYSLLAGYGITQLFHLNVANSFFFYALFSHLLLILSCLVFVFKISKNVLLTTLVTLLIASSNWLNFYAFYYHYTSLSTAIFTISILLLLTYVYSPQKDNILLYLSGVVAGLIFWTSSSGAVELLCYGFCLLITIFRKLNRQQWFFLGLSFYCTFIPFFSRSFYMKLAHIKANLGAVEQHQLSEYYNNHWSEVLGTYFKIQAEYNYWVLMAFLVAVGLCLGKKMGAKKCLSPFSIMACVMLSIVILHDLMINILPTTKLARTHFHTHPMFVLAIVILTYYESEILPKILRKGLLFILFGTIFYSNIMDTIQIRDPLHSTYVTLNETMQASKSVYIFEEDIRKEHFIQFFNSMQIVPKLISYKDWIDKKSKLPLDAPLFISPNIRFDYTQGIALQVTQNYDFKELLQSVPYVRLPMHHPYLFLEQELFQFHYFKGFFNRFKDEKLNALIIPKQ